MTKSKAMKIKAAFLTHCKNHYNWTQEQLEKWAEKNDNIIEITLFGRLYI